MSTHSSEFLHASPTAKTSVRYDVPQIVGRGSENLLSSDPREDHFADELIFQRSVQVYLAALPAVGMMAMRDASEKAFGSGYNVLLTSYPVREAAGGVAHPSAISCLDLRRDGPLVVTVPPGVLGVVTDFWQRMLTDLGLLGPDGGEGGSYLLLPPGHEEPPPSGHFIVRSRTNNVFLFLQAPATRGTPDSSLSTKIFRRVRIRSFGTISKTAPAMKLKDAAQIADALAPCDASFFDLLARFMDYEPAEATEPFIHAMLETLGISKGRSFKPERRIRRILDKAATATSRARNAPPATAETIRERLWYTGHAGRLWQRAPLALSDSNPPAALPPSRSEPEIAPVLSVPQPNQSVAEEVLSGEHSYELHVPANPPVRLFWAVTLYGSDGKMRTDGSTFSSVNSMNSLEQNADGSCDLYFGPSPPPGKSRSNWIKTDPGQSYRMAFRNYGPMEPIVDGPWGPGALRSID